jgi:hypothetical protein
MWKSFLQHNNDHGGRQTQIDRINNNGDYSKENCHWVTSEQNQNNKRSNRKITIDGKVNSMSGWSKDYNVPIATFHYRMKNGMSPKKALGLK